MEEAFRRAGATILNEDEKPEKGGITKADFYRDGLTGAPDSGERRRRLTQELGFPAYLSTARLLDAVNALMTKEEYQRIMDELR